MQTREPFTRSLWIAASFCLIPPHVPPTLFFPVSDGKEGPQPKVHVPAGINSHFICSQFVVNGRGQAHIPVQEASKFTGSTKQELSKEISSLGFDMKCIIILDFVFASSGPMLNLDLLTGWK